MSKNCCTIWLADGRRVSAYGALPECTAAGICVCGFCKGEGQCQFGDCRNPLPAADAGTLCLTCSASAWKVALPGHRASVA